jgi:ubiquinone biosynthesis protein COQ4
MEDSTRRYLKAGGRPLTTDSSILISSSKYLNSAPLRHIVAQEMLRKQGTDLTPEYFIPEIVSAFDELVDREAILKLFEAERRRSPIFTEWLDARYLSKFDVGELAHFKPGTLGARIHQFITVSGFDVDFMFKSPPASDYEYWLKRFIQSHDIQHMVTGFDLTPIGEYGLIMLNTTEAFENFSPELAAELSRQPTFSVACGLMQANLHHPKTMPLLLQALDLGRKMALHLKKPLFYARWENYLKYTIAEIREELGITGAPKEGRAQ